MRNLIIVASALLLVSCATSKGSASDGTESGASDHDCGGDCGCDHGDKAEGHAKPHGDAHDMGNFADHVDALFAKLDADKDAALTKEEIGEHHLAEKFDTADADSDGKISREEMLTFGKAMHGKKAEEKEAAPAEEATEEAPAPEAETTPTE